MRRLAVLFLFFSLTASATFTRLQMLSNSNGTGSGAGTTSCNGSSPETCTITIAATTAGSLQIVYLILNNNVLTSLSGGGAWVQPASCAIRPTNNALACGYILSSTGGTTSFTATIPASGNYRGMIYAEYSSTSLFLFDAAATANNGSTTTSAGPALTLSGRNDVIIVASYDSVQTPSSPQNGYTILTLTSCVGCGRWGQYLENTNSGLASSVTMGSAATSLVSAIAMMEYTPTRKVTSQ